jgi:predicted transcriptional regulator
MRQENVQYFTEKEEEFVNLLIDIGIRKNVALVLMFLANTTETTSRGIEHGTDLRQPEVSIAMKYLMERGWIKTHQSSSTNKGRPLKVYELAISISKIMNTIEKEKKDEANTQLALVKKMRDYI